MLNDQYSEMLFQETSRRAEEKHQFLPAQKLGAKLSIDGDQYCFLLGDNIQAGIAGFGKSPYAAMCAFNDEFYRDMKQGIR